MILHIKSYLKNDASSEIIKSIPEDEDSLIFFYIINHSVCDQLLPYLK